MTNNITFPRAKRNDKNLDPSIRNLSPFITTAGNELSKPYLTAALSTLQCIRSKLRMALRIQKCRTLNAHEPERDRERFSTATCSRSGCKKMQSFRLHSRP